MYGETLCTVLLFSLAGAAKILGVFMGTSYSHQVVYQPIWRELSLRGHQVTVYTPNPLNDPSLTNLTEIDLSFSYKAWQESYLDSMTGVTESRSVDYSKIIKGLADIYESQMSSPQMQDLLVKRNNETYDIFLVEYMYPPMYTFKDVYKCPMIGIGSMPLTIFSAGSLGMDKHPALDPDPLLAFADDLTFRERVISTVYKLLYKLNMVLKVGPQWTAISRKYFGKLSRDCLDIANEVSIVLGNSNFVTQNIRPTVPGFIDISGIHIHPESTLPKDLQKILDDSKQGVIYFSLGTNVQSSHLSKQKRQEFLKAFSELPYKVLWKVKGDDVQNSSNIVTRQWFPQQEILRHPNVKLFITQGGLQSIDEALYGSVPMLMVPFFGDQFFNAQKMTTKGVALTLNYQQFTKNDLVDKIRKLVNDPKYKNAASELKSVAFDQPMGALDRAVWWIEYILRHNGAEHLKYKAVDTPFYVYHMLDVYIFLGAIIFIVIYITVKILKRVIIIYNFCRRSLQTLGVICGKSLKKEQ